MITPIWGILGLRPSGLKQRTALLPDRNVWYWEGSDSVLKKHIIIMGQTRCTKVIPAFWRMSASRSFDVTAKLWADFPLPFSQKFSETQNSKRQAVMDSSGRCYHPQNPKEFRSQSRGYTAGLLSWFLFSWPPSNSTELWMCGEKSSYSSLILSWRMSHLQVFEGCASTWTTQKQPYCEDRTPKLQ